MAHAHCAPLEEGSPHAAPKSLSTPGSQPAWGKRGARKKPACPRVGAGKKDVPGALQGLQQTPLASVWGRLNGPAQRLGARAGPVGQSVQEKRRLLPKLLHTRGCA